MFHGGISLLNLLDPKKVLPPPPMQFLGGGCHHICMIVAKMILLRPTENMKKFSQQLE